ncbi:mobilisation protein (plasmid) [Glutamicibacter arilaitensis Re117]|uniref:Mobilisation protein n=1 Tax=Glutamicibacter arilaitensis (strain DSM 16368 / CIP 108037 / IAM 15318 / JCM 13566 / NCIMB 14258 / Re117) TaxID=861360 RepID=A0ABM9PSS0_GLUAR|nr:relaxase/mobilization nuclease domain-containing protein [Glutamicibacter arilaitensis]CBQ74093.1 mobilisation protein [Glutamicibacter arilaitensis Re117]
MIAKITRGKNPGDIGAYLHGPGKANEHTYTAAGQRVSGGVVVGSNIGAEGQTDPRWWAGELRKALNTRPEIKNPVWHASLRNTKADRTLTNEEWADVGQSFAEGMGYAEHPWVMVRHGDDHVHIVVSRVSDVGDVWHGRNDRRAAQSACTRLEQENGLEKAPRRRIQPKLAVTAEREEARGKAHALGSHRAVKEAERRELEAHRARIREMREANFPNPPTTRSPSKGIVPVVRPYTPLQPSRDEGRER